MSLVHWSAIDSTYDEPNSLTNVLATCHRVPKRISVDVLVSLYSLDIENRTSKVCLPIRTKVNNISDVSCKERRDL